MPENTRRMFLKTVGVAVGTARIAGVNSFESADVPKTTSDATLDGSAPAETPPTNWSTFQHDAANTGHAEDAGGVNETPWIEWSELLPQGHIPELSAPVVVDGVAYLITDEPSQSVVAYDVDARETKWVSDALSDSRPFDAAPTIVDGLVFVASVTRVHALNAGDGSEA
jgi:outer membrane protein assembly factor BamB